MQASGLQETLEVMTTEGSTSLLRLADPPKSSGDPIPSALYSWNRNTHPIPQGCIELPLRTLLPVCITLVSDFMSCTLKCVKSRQVTFFFYKTSFLQLRHFLFQVRRNFDSPWENLKGEEFAAMEARSHGLSETLFPFQFTAQSLFCGVLPHRHQELPSMFS